MAVFLVLSQFPSHTDVVRSLIERNYERRREIGSNAWLVADEGNARKVSEKLGVTADGGSPAIILEVASYWGRADPDIWNWIKTNWEATAHG